MSIAKKLTESLKCQFNEATLGRLVQHVQNGDCLAFISAERDDVEKEVNVENTKALRNYASNLARSLKLGYFKAKGGYVELKDDGSKKNVDGENSIIIFAPSDQFEIVKEFAISMGIKFKQDSVMLVDPTGIAKWIATRPDSSVGSQVGKKAFSFAKIEEGFEPKSKATSIQLRGSDYFCNLIKECVKQNLSFYEAFFEEKHKDKLNISV